MSRVVKRFDLPSGENGRWAGLVVDVEQPALPGLRVEVTLGRRLLVRQGDRVALLGRQRFQHRGVHYVRTNLYRSFVPAITTVQARQIRETSSSADTWAARWGHRFVDWMLASNDAPLHAGSWVLAHGMPRWSAPSYWRRLHTFDPDQGHITWFGYGDPEEDARDILPLRRLSSPQAARVKSYRRQVREKILPPVLLWWLSGLNTLVVLDGHDRIVAALEEQTIPDVIVLARQTNPQWINALEQLPIKEYQGRINQLESLHNQRYPLASLLIANASRNFAQQLAEVARFEGPTRSWLIPGGRAAWDQYVSNLAPNWPQAAESKSLS